MSESPDRDSKTEEPTEKKTSDALEKGNVPHSREAATLASLLGVLIVISFFVVDGVAHLTSTLHLLIDNPAGWSLEGYADASRLFQAIGVDALRLLLPVVIVLAGAGILSSVLQNSPRLVLERIRPTSPACPCRRAGRASSARKGGWSSSRPSSSWAP